MQEGLTAEIEDHLTVIKNIISKSYHNPLNNVEEVLKLLSKIKSNSSSEDINELMKATQLSLNKLTSIDLNKAISVWKECKNLFELYFRSRERQILHLEETKSYSGLTIEKLLEANRAFERTINKDLHTRFSLLKETMSKLPNQFVIKRLPLNTVGGPVGQETLKSDLINIIILLNEEVIPSLQINEREFSKYTTEPSRPISKISTWFSRAFWKGVNSYREEPKSISELKQK